MRRCVVERGLYLSKMMIIEHGLTRVETNTRRKTAWSMYD